MMFAVFPILQEDNIAKATTPSCKEDTAVHATIKEQVSGS
jgi:hypothetical protein